MDYLSQSKLGYMFKMQFPRPHAISEGAQILGAIGGL